MLFTCILEMWLWIITGFNILINVHGFASGGFPQSCGSMLPEHGNPAHDTEPPFLISYEEGNDEELFTVSLRSKNSIRFKGFMLQARDEEDNLVGTFKALNAYPTTLLDCDGTKASAVSQGDIQDKRLFEVQWIWPVESRKNKTNFRATFLSDFRTFWVNVLSPVNPTTTTTNEPGTTKPNTTPGTTKPDTTPGTTKPDTTPGTTKPNTTPGTTKSSILSPSTFKQPIVLMVIDSLLVPVKLEMSNMITNSPLSRRLDRMSKILFLVTCGALEIAALCLTIVFYQLQATLIALACVVITLTIVEIVNICLPLGPSHELSRKEICDLCAKVCSVIHEAFTLAFIYVGCLEIIDSTKNRTEPWPLWTLIAYTMWIVLVVVWVFVTTTERNAIPRRKKRETSSMNSGHRGQRKEVMLHAAKVAVRAGSGIVIIGTIAFAVALIVGIL
ncbi:uncharacterized protein LOC117806328 [Notolabrus celidotus]|uniref:uncharacterized protein LOC117806328 n=1 Tax=Notolabrus celidotus TaxID=1203425 RepID=UPI00148F9AC1|nr:uncharacterized protein LOC117806328 [Notolabrus celidotus]